MMHLGPYFPTYLHTNSATISDKIFSKKHHYLNYFSEPGEIPTSDHIRIIFRLSTKPFITETLTIYKTSKETCEHFKATLDNNITLKDINNC